ncbi:MAG: hypothetical protein L3J79_01575 [Candidatus Marinimicrobia bacterium]|nr:hypothetical protein [Candidatus Neomarinimicrobiota bacterium]
MAKNKNIAKRQAKAAKRKVQKRKLRLVKARKQQHQQKNYQDDYNYPPPGIGTPPFDDDIETPAGFRVVGMSEALMEFARSMIRHPDIKGLNSMEDAFNLAMPLWNFAISQGQGEAGDKLRAEIIKALMPACKISRDEAGELADKAVARKNEMFPPEVQPQGTRYMFMRKEVLHLVTPFNYERLTLSDEVIPLGGRDRRFFEQFAALDEVKKGADDYEEWDKQYEIVRENFGEVFVAWLLAKGGDDELADKLTFKAEFFINFIYNYGCTDILRNTDYDCFDEFFYDFVLRKIMLDDPGEHVEWVPALRLLFVFLAEKDYVNDDAPYIEAINGFEEPFLTLLRKEYG